jgi:hypothetical protein
VRQCDSSCSASPTLLDYNTSYSSPNTNACWAAGAISTAISNKWTHILGEGTEIQVTVSKANGSPSSCSVQVAGKGSCPCSVGCQIKDLASVSYNDCSAYYKDKCAKMNCDGTCGGNGSGALSVSALAPKPAPATAPTPAPVTAPKPASVSAPKPAPVADPKPFSSSPVATVSYIAASCSNSPGCKA